MKEDGWFESKRYLHFDIPVNKETAFTKVSNTQNIATHQFLPFLSFIVKSPKYQYDEIKKKRVIKTKDREICYCSHMDGHIYSYYSKILLEKYESLLKKENLENNILAFRKIGNGKCNIDFAYEAFNEIKSYKKSAVIALDFSKFFDTLDHDILKKQWCKVLDESTLPLDHFKVFKSLTKFSKVDKNQIDNLFCRKKAASFSKICTIKEFREIIRPRKLIKTNKIEGIPQGSPLSGLLSNIYMIDFDKKMKDYIERLNGKYYRYCDDMLIITPHIELRDKIEKFAKEAIKNLKVTINEKKTELRTFIRDSKNFKIKKKHLKNRTNAFQNKSIMIRFNKLKSIDNKPLQYLGFIFDGENIYVRSSSISRFYSKMRRGVSRAKFHMKKKNEERKRKSFEDKNLFKQNLYERYSHLGKSNFVTYTRRCREIMEESTTIRNQMKKFDKTLKKRLNKIKP